MEGSTYLIKVSEVVCHHETQKTLCAVLHVLTK